jgi:hypothetical protein
LVRTTKYDGIETTGEELEGFHVVKAICREVVEGNRITYRDSKNYFAVFIDDNNRKPICRLHFNRTQKYLGIFDAQKVETKIPIESIDDIYKHSAAIQEMASLWAA